MEDKQEKMDAVKGNIVRLVVSGRKLGMIKMWQATNWNKKNQLWSVMSTGKSLSAGLSQWWAGDCEDAFQRGLVWRASSERVTHTHTHTWIIITSCFKFLDWFFSIAADCFHQRTTEFVQMLNMFLFTWQEPSGHTCVIAVCSEPKLDFARVW